MGVDVCVLCFFVSSSSSCWLVDSYLAFVCCPLIFFVENRTYLNIEEKHRTAYIYVCGVGLDRWVPATCDVQLVRQVPMRHPIKEDVVVVREKISIPWLVFCLGITFSCACKKQMNEEFLFRVIMLFFGVFSRRCKQ